MLARRAGAGVIPLPRAQVGVILATAVMYLRMLGIIAVFDTGLATSSCALLGLSVLGFLLAALLYWHVGRPPPETVERAAPSDPLELSAAALFAILSWLSRSLPIGRRSVGAGGVYILAAIVGVTDIDPFVLSVAQGSATSLSVATATTAILVATSSNNVLKAAYAARFAGWRGSLPTVAILSLLSGAALTLAFVLSSH